jgi:hypothetical protein
VPFNRVPSAPCYSPEPPHLGQVIFPTPEHSGHSFPFTFVLPLHIGHLIVPVLSEYSWL